MLIFGTLGIAVTAIAVWSTIHGQNGFAELPKLLKGEPAFVVQVKESEFAAAGRGEGGPFIGVPESEGGSLPDEGKGSGGGGGGAW